MGKARVSRKGKSTWPPNHNFVSSLDRKWHADCDLPLPPEDTITEHALLIGRGVRPLAIVSMFSADIGAMYYAAIRLDHYAVKAGDDVIAFVVDDGDGLAYCGFAGAPWVVELLEFALKSKAAQKHKHSILGVLLGYSARAIQRHEQFDAGKMLNLGGTHQK